MKKRRAAILQGNFTTDSGNQKLARGKSKESHRHDEGERKGGKEAAAGCGRGRSLRINRIPSPAKKGNLKVSIGGGRGKRGDRKS